MFRPTLRFAGLCAGLLISANVLALSLSDLSQQDATGGLKDALTQGAQLAVKQLGTPGGFSNNPEVKIELPGKLGKAASKMKAFGMGAQVEELETAMNKAAENVYGAIRRDGTQQNVIDTMQTRMELYDAIDYHVFEQKLDALFASKK